MTLPSMELSLAIIQAFAVLGACGSVLMIGISVFRSMDSIERRLARMDSVLDQMEDRANTNTVAR